MAQLHCYVPNEIADRLRRRARARGVTVSALITDLVRASVAPEWPSGFFEEVVGGWQGEPLERPEPLPLEARPPF